MKKIKLTQGKVALVSNEDFARVNSFKWYASKESRGKKYYAIRRETIAKGRRVKIRMHRFILGLPPGILDPEERVVDHLDRNSLNNQRENLEIVSQFENMARVPNWKRPKSVTEEPYL